MKKKESKSVDVIDEVLAEVGAIESSADSEEGIETTSPALSGQRMVGGYVVPDGAQRVRVLNEKGRLSWRKIDEFGPTDTVDLTNKGQPQWMMGELGRPKQASLHEELPPTNPLTRDLLRIKQANLRTDPIVLAAESTPDGAVMLDQVMQGLAEEAASLRFERQEAERNGKDSSAFSMRRVGALKAIGDTFLKRKEVVQNQVIDLDSPTFQKVFTFITETMTRSMVAAGIRQESIDSAFSNFSKSLDEEWKNEARNRMKSEE